MAGFDFSTYNVLVCDSDPDVMSAAKETFEEAGIRKFVGTPSPENAINRIPELRPDLIMVSMMFPSVNGIQVIQKIRALEDGAFNTTPILLTLDKVSQGLLREACRCGIEGAMRKPITKDKLLRFARSVILKPRRFICVRNYFGPERRTRSDPHFDGDDRRQTGPHQAQDASHSVKAGVVLSSKTKKKETDKPIDWTSSDKPKEKAQVMEFGGSSLSGEKKPADWEFEGGPQKAKTETPDFDFTSQDKAPETAQDMDFTSRDKASAPAPDVTETKTKPVAEAKDLPESPKVADATPEKRETAEPTGPDTESFEEVIDLEECLNLHKIWINSGGASGQQANRPSSDFRNTELVEVDFTKAQLPQSNFEKVDCSGAVFRKADLSGSTFKEALLSSSDLAVTLLRKADMRQAKLDKANLLGADISGANFEGATLRGVNLSGARMSRTNLRGVDLTSTQGLIPEQIRNAITDQKTRLPHNLQTS